MQQDSIIFRFQFKRATDTRTSRRDHYAISAVLFQSILQCSCDQSVTEDKKDLSNVLKDRISIPPS